MSNTCVSYNYRPELEQVQRLGCLNHLLLAYSRQPGEPKQYVQDAIKANSQP